MADILKDISVQMDYGQGPMVGSLHFTQENEATEGQLPFHIL